MEFVIQHRHLKMKEKEESLHPSDSSSSSKSSKLCFEVGKEMFELREQKEQKKNYLYMTRKKSNLLSCLFFRTWQKWESEQQKYLSFYNQIKENLVCYSETGKIRRHGHITSKLNFVSFSISKTILLFQHKHFKANVPTHFSTFFKATSATFHTQPTDWLTG